jgi:hypothetical protein
MLILANSSFSQSIRNIVNIYPGPRNSNELARVLSTSTRLVIEKLDCSTKASLETYMYFENGLPAGFIDTDANINRIFADTAYSGRLFTAIFGIKTLVGSLDNLPKVQNITLAEFYKLIGGGANGVADPLPYCSLCYNCDREKDILGGEGPCCLPTSPNKCCDIIVNIAGNFYNVIP